MNLQNGCNNIIYLAQRCDVATVRNYTIAYRQWTNQSNASAGDHHLYQSITIRKEKSARKARIRLLLGGFPI